MMAQSLPFARYYEAARDACKQPKLVANWLMGEVSAALNEAVIGIEQLRVSPRLLAMLIARVQTGTISHKSAKQLFGEWFSTAGTATGSVSISWSVAGPTDAELDASIAAKGLKQLNDGVALEKIVDDVLSANTKSVEEFRAGKDKAFNALVGQVMKASKGQANPAQAGELLRKKLGPG
jgi:aspartyl-tRNA(Asn)/glutamyl-tRNA(Gln) amidotransferase subunit B